MSSGCGDVLSLEDLKTAKKHQLFEAEVITGKQGGVAGGAAIDYATNQVTGQTQKTIPAVLRDVGFEPASFTFDTGGTLGINDADVAVLWPGPGGDGQYYVWRGTLPKVIPAASTPATAGGISSTTWVPFGDITLRNDLAAASGAALVGASGGGTVQDAIDSINTQYLSTYNGDISLALSERDTILIDIDYALSSDVVVGSHKTLKTVNGATITAAGGLLKTEAVFSPQYYKDVPENLQKPLAISAVSGGTSLELIDASGVSVGDKLIIKNGYCDMWRVLESSDAETQRRAVNSLTYKTEIIEVISKIGNVLTVTPLLYDYPLVPVTYGYISNENALSEYAGYTRPSVTKLLYKNIKLDLDILIPSGVTNPVMQLAYVDGLELSMRVQSNATIHAPFSVAMSDVNIHDVTTEGHAGGILWVQETSRGLMTNLKATNWRGGHDSPFIVMLMSNINVSEVSTSASEKYTGSSACYINTCDGGTMVNLFGKNLAKVADFTFSRQVVASSIVGKNCDFVAGAFASSGCKVNGAEVDGYCFQNASTTIFTPTLIYCSNTTNVSYDNVTRINDKGYGRIRFNGSIGTVVGNLKAPETTMHTIIANMANEIAFGNNNNVVAVNSAVVGGFVRESAYYNAGDEYGAVYPMCRYNDIRVKNGGVIDVGGFCNQDDYFHLYSTSVATLGSGFFGVEIAGFLGGITCPSSAKNTCYPYIKNLKLVSKPTSGVFHNVDTMMTDGSVWSIVYYNGGKISDVYSRKAYVNSGNKGSAPVWVLS